MKNKTILSFLVFFTTAFSLLFSQNITISGTVSDISSIPLPGVNIQVKGTTNGTSTDFDGNYKISANQGDVLIFSFLGFKTKEVKVSGTSLNVSLEEDASKLDEIVVTAMGIKKEKKSLGYSVQSIKAEGLTDGNQTSLVNGLQGKISGVTVVNSGGAPGSSAVILIRGGSSITGNNQPLMIVDGLPIDNSTSSSLEVASTNRATDINPEDIESISVLKGPAAAALYGIQAAGGAVVITTKKGKAGVSEVTYSGSLSIDNVLGTPDIQTLYGQGNQIVGQTGTTIDPESAFSWGNTISGSKFNNLKDFYTTAITSNHTVSYSGGNDKSSLYFSIGDISQDGVIKSTSYDKTSFKINTTSKITENLTLGITGNYITTKTSSTKQGNASGGSFLSLLSYPANVDAKDYLNEDGSQKSFFVDQQFDNPYWSEKHSPNKDNVQRLIGAINLNYNFLNDFNLNYKLGIDNFTQFNKKITGDGSLIENREDGYISQYESDSKRLNSNLLLTYQKNITEDFSVNALLGNSVEEFDARTVYTYGDGFQAPGIYSIGNVLKENQSISELITRKRIVGVFGELKLGWQNALFLTATGRNDWSSTLPKDKRSFFYPSIGLSAVITDLFKNAGNDITSSNGLTYLQLRSTWAKVGKDAPIGALESSLGTNINGLASSAYTYNGVNVGNPLLEPEFTKSFEIGFDMRLFESRVGLDFTYYKSKSENQILRDIRVPPTTGTFYATLNGGSITTSGLEALLSIKVLPPSSAFNWNVDFNFGANTSKVNELPGFLNEVYLSDSWTFNSTAAGAAILDGSLFGLRGYRPQKNANGEVVINSNGLPTLVQETFDNVDRMPDWTLGITNTFKYKDFRLSFLLDLVQGFDVYNATESALDYYGVSKQTANRNETIILPGVDSNGAANTVAVAMDQAFYQNYYYKNSENFIEDGSFARLRYVTFAYNFPKTLLDKMSLSSLELSVTGRNLFTITNYSGVDPEVNTFGAGIAGAGSMSIDNLGTPNTKGVDFGLKVRF